MCEMHVERVYWAVREKFTIYMKLFKELPLKFALFPFLLVLYRNFLAFLLTLGEFILSYLSRIALLLFTLFPVIFPLSLNVILLLVHCVSCNMFRMIRWAAKGFYLSTVNWRLEVAMTCELQPSSLCSKAERLSSKLSVGMIFLVILVHNVSGAKSFAKKICKKILGAPFKVVPRGFFFFS